MNPDNSSDPTPALQPQARRRQTVVMASAAAAALAVGAGAAWWRFTPDTPTPGIVQTLLDQTYPDATGESLSLTRFRGQAMVVNFWATWCAPCVEEMPELSQIADEIRPLKVEVLGIGVDSLANISKFAERIKVSYPLVSVGGAGIELAKQFGNLAGGLPFTVLVDRRGEIQGRIIGRFNGSELLLRAKALA